MIVRIAVFDPKGAMGKTIVTVNLARLGRAWQALPGDGIRNKRVDFGEAIVRLGLDHPDEIRVKRNWSPQEADA